MTDLLTAPASATPAWFVADLHRRRSLISALAAGAELAEVWPAADAWVTPRRWAAGQAVT